MNDKSTDEVPTWEEWSKQLTEEQRQYSQYKILSKLDRRIYYVEGQVRVLKNRKWIDRAASGIGGIIGGILAILGIKAGS